MKSEKFVANESYGEWQGEYIIGAISAADHIEIEEKIVKYMKQKGKDPTKQSEYPIHQYRAFALLKSVLKDGKPLKYTADQLLQELPNKLYMILSTAYSRLNEPSREEADFLSNL